VNIIFIVNKHLNDKNIKGEMMPNSFETLKQTINNHFSLTFEKDGFSPLVGKIFALLIFAPEPLSLQELADQLHVTKAAISVQVRTLEQHCMCQRLARGSDRKDYYFIQDDFSTSIIHHTTDKINTVLTRMDAMIQNMPALQEVSAQNLASYQASKRRFIEMRALYQLFTDRLEGIDEEWEQRRQQLADH
jgi:DNA-binding transcriptional regulator GbsR (MarR family)